MQNVSDLKVNELRTEPLILVSNTPVSSLVGILREYNAYEAFIFEKSKIAMVTMRDLLRAKNIAKRKISTLAKYVPKLSPEQKVARAAGIMTDYRIRALPIVDGKDLIGIIEAQSIIEHINDSQLLSLSVDKAMKSNPITIGKSTSVMKALNLMIKRDIDHLPVIESKALVGMIHSSHVVYRLVPSESPRKGAMVPETRRRMDIPASALMDTNPLQCNSDEKIRTVINLMRKRKVDYSLVRLWEELQGIITYRDIMRAIIKPPERQIPVYIVGLPDDPFEAETARTKFTNVIHILSKRFPSIEEARSKIKSGKQKSERRKRYEVSVVIKTSKRMYSYSEIGWDLPSIYDKISSRLKRLLTQKRVRKRDVRGIRPSL